MKPSTRQQLMGTLQRMDTRTTKMLRRTKKNLTIRTKMKRMARQQKKKPTLKMIRKQKKYQKMEKCLLSSNTANRDMCTSAMPTSSWRQCARSSRILIQLSTPQSQGPKASNSHSRKLMDQRLSSGQDSPRDLQDDSSSQRRTS